MGWCLGFVGPPSGAAACPCGPYRRGRTWLRFTPAQVAYDPEHVEATLRAVARRLARDPGTESGPDVTRTG